MKKLKCGILETNITKLILLSMALTIGMVALISSASAAAPTPSYGTAVVNGQYNEWNLENDYFANMYQAFNQGGNKPLLSKLYLRYDCSKNTMYALVLNEPNIPALQYPNDAWIAIDGINNKVVTGNSGNDTVPPDFAWVYNTNGILVGYEASFPLTEASHKIIAHIEVDYGGAQTSGTIKDNDGIDLTISCPVTASIGDFVWNDLNRNGIQEDGETGIAGVTVELYACDGTTPIASTTTDANGFYQFTGLMPGEYQVKFVLPSEYAFSPQDQGSDDAKDSDADTTTGMTDCITLTSGQTDNTWDAGMYQLVEKLTVSKTAVTSYTRTHKWDIDKSVTTQKGYMHEGFPKIWLYIDGSGDENAMWTVDVTYGGSEDKNFDISGVITIQNTGDLPATITSIEDVLGGTPVTVSCEVEFPYVLEVGKTLECSYSKTVDSKIGGSNDVTVTTGRNKNYEASAEIVWSDTPTEELYKTITVKDSSDLFGEQDLGTVTAPENKQFTYSKDFAWMDYGKDKCGDYTYKNTATIVETGQSADATLKVNVQCYMYETAYAKGDNPTCFYPTFTNWGWTNQISSGTYTMDLWAGAAKCDTTKGALVGTVTVVYGTNGYVTVTYNVGAPYLLQETHMYAGTTKFPMVKNKQTVAPGQYSNASPFKNGEKVYVIAHAVVGIPDPNFGPK